MSQIYSKNVIKYIIEVYNYSVFYELCCANIADTILSLKSHTFSNSLLIF